MDRTALVGVGAQRLLELPERHVQHLANVAVGPLPRRDGVLHLPRNNVFPPLEQHFHREVHQPSLPMPSSCAASASGSQTGCRQAKSVQT